MDVLTLALGFVKKFWPFILAGAVGWSIAWNIQGMKLDHAKNKFEEYKVEQVRLLNEANEKQEKRREATAQEWSNKYDRLQQDHDLYRRCVAAGKCGSLRPVSCSTGLKLPATLGANEASADPVPSTGGYEEEMISPVLRDCAKTTLMLNTLQSDIEKQEGYKK